MAGGVAGKGERLRAGATTEVGDGGLFCQSIDKGKRAEGGGITSRPLTVHAGEIFAYQIEVEIMDGIVVVVHSCGGMWE